MDKEKVKRGRGRGWTNAYQSNKEDQRNGSKGRIERRQSEKEEGKESGGMQMGRRERREVGEIYAMEIMKKGGT